ncbi:heterokaryon incompatibility protein-domain-containing protein [Xylariaceae sp. FL1272]|nr:heterokaryon incompatibility protein-domain-containing protein [Xylariaceae sp. FL1272]
MFFIPNRLKVTSINADSPLVHFEKFLEHTISQKVRSKYDYKAKGMLKAGAKDWERERREAYGWNFEDRRVRVWRRHLPFVCELSYDLSRRSSRFSYTRLEPGQIRLLVLHPGKMGDELQCSIIIVAQRPNVSAYKKLEVEMPYQAVSYAWGDSDRRHTLKCNLAGYGMMSVHNEMPRPMIGYNSFESVLHINTSVYEMLQRLRHPEQGKAYWIDAICINQDDKTERAEQVKMMRSIYANAYEVIVWLGPCHDDVEQPLNAFAAINALAAMAKNVDDGVPVPSQDTTTFRPWHLDKSDAFYLDRTQWIAFLLGLLHLPWFQRTWIRQEIALATEAIIIWGSHETGWEKLSRACRAVSDLKIQEIQEAQGTAINTYKIVDDLTKERTACRGLLEGIDVDLYNISLARLLTSARNSKASDPRDKVFGLLGMAILHDRVPLDINYTLPVRDVYTQVAQYLFNAPQSNPIEFLLAVQGVSEDSNKFYLPSWVPNWNIGWLTNRHPKHQVHAANSRRTEAEVFWNHDCDAKISQFRWGRSLSRHCLRVKGAQILTVRQMASFVDYQAQWDMLYFLPQQHYPMTATSYFDMYHQKLRNPDEPEHFFLSSLRDPKRRFWSCQSYTEHGIHRDSITDTAWSPEELKARLSFKRLSGKLQLKTQTRSIQIHRQLFVSTNGFMGAVPLDTQMDDLIVVFFGASVPFVVRRVYGDHYQFMGECYVLGVMEGEAMEDLPEDKVQDFYLC